MIFSIFFWAFFEQAGSSVSNFTDRNVDRVVGGDVLEVAGHGVEAQAAAGVDVAEAHEPLGRKGAPDRGQGRQESLVAGVLHGPMLPAIQVPEINRLTSARPAWCSGCVLGTRRGATREAPFR